MHARARTAACGVGPWSRCCGEYPCAQQEGRSAAAVHATPVCRRHCGPWRRQCTQAVWPRRSVTGAIPAYVWRAAAAAERWRGAPQATRRCGAKTGSAPGRAWSRGQAGGRCARCAMAVSNAARACTRISRRISPDSSNVSWPWTMPWTPPGVPVLSGATRDAVPACPRHWPRVCPDAGARPARVGPPQSPTHGDVSRCGPLNHDSGTLRGHRTIWGGRAHVRAPCIGGRWSRCGTSPGSKPFTNGCAAQAKSRKWR